MANVYCVVDCNKCKALENKRQSIHFGENKRQSIDISCIHRDVSFPNRDLGNQKVAKSMAQGDTMVCAISQALFHISFNLNKIVFLYCLYVYFLQYHLYAIF